MTQYVHQPAFMTGDEFSIPTFSLLNPEGELHGGAIEPVLERDHARRIYQAML
ncbi:MAG TPA: thiamine pyrophosphate-dependent dehydrogenase E1 component subunit alpha, partial [Halomonas sp.]|nr:thiamine pyrophosphate-dependent dehydrogenase E1 component subunit alpha [Halomonas sp.]